MSSTQYIILFTATTAWCALHSAMISVRVTQTLQKRTGAQFRYYRLFFNFVALFSLIPLIFYKRTLQTEPFFDWDGYLRIVQILFIALAFVFFFLGAKKYDARRFFGLAQLKETNTRQSMAATTELDTSGIHSLVRHPWYTALLMLLWSRPLDASTLIINTVFSGYLIIGSLLEEKKLVMEFGDSYVRYQKSVSMLLPLKWLRAKFRHS